MNLSKVLNNQFNRYPMMKCQDAVKLIYQSEFGAKHFYKGFDEILKENETADVPNKRYEDIGNGYARVHLGGLTKVQCKALSKLFEYTMYVSSGNEKNFIKKLSNAKLNVIDLNLFDDKDKNFVNRYITNGIKPVSHTDTYRKKYKPHYRVVVKDGIKILPLIEEIENRSSDKELVISVDGKCGSGKTYFAQMISKMYDCNVIQMDSFFLPMEMRTDKRLAQVAGNIHYERFREQVLDNINKKEFSYDIFDCKTMNYAKTANVKKKKLTIIEGTYSQSNDFKKYYDLNVCLWCNSTLQIKRIKHRNGKIMLKQFSEKWIPMEERYLEQEKVRNACDIFIVT